MNTNIKLIHFFVNSFIRRDFDEMSSCLDDNFIYETASIKTVGKYKFLKLQEKFDCNYKMTITNLDVKQNEGVYHASFKYDIFYPGHQLIEIDATAKLNITNHLIDNIFVIYENNSEANKILKKMILH